MLEQITNEHIGRGYRGTKRTLDKMHKLVQQAKLDPTMQRIATWIRINVPEDKRSRSRALADEIFHWVKKHGIYQRDPFQIEKIEHPVVSMRPVLEARKKGAYQGPGLFATDCDGFSIWIGALGGILGFQYAFEAAKLDPKRDEFSHVWPALHVEGEWVAYDASTPSSYPGWRPRGPMQRWAEKPIDTMKGLAGMSNYNGNGALPNYEKSRNIPNPFYRQYFESSVPLFLPAEIDGISEVPVATPSRLNVQVPPEPATNQGDLRPPDLTFTRKVLAREPEERMPMEPSSYWPYPNYQYPRGSYYTGRNTPPGWPWNVQVETIPYEGMVEAVGAAGFGQADVATVSGAASKTVLETIGDALKNVLQIAPQIGLTVIQQKQMEYQAKVAEAQARVAEAARRQAIAAGGAPPLGIPIATIALIGVAGLGAYFLFLKPKKGSGGSRGGYRRRTRRRR